MKRRTDDKEGSIRGGDCRVERMKGRKKRKGHLESSLYSRLKTSTLEKTADPPKAEIAVAQMRQSAKIHCRDTS